MEHDVGRHPACVGHLGPALAKGLEQSAVDAVPGGRVSFGASSSLTRSRSWLSKQCDVGLTFEGAHAVVRQLQDGVGPVGTH